MIHHNKISILILNYNGREDTIECLASILNLDYPLFNVIVIDNASGDHSVEKIIDWSNCKFITNVYPYSEAKKNKDEYAETVPDLLIVRNSENVGFAAGCNQGVRLALSNGADYVWLLNNDTVIESDSLSIMSTYLDDHSDCFAVTPQIRLYDEPDRIWNCGGMLKWYGVRKYHYVHKPVSDLPGRKTLEVTFVTGCALLVRSHVFMGMGGFTERFFFGEEDFDLSLRLKKVHANMVCCMDSIIYHKVGASIDRSIDRFNMGKAYIHYLNRFINLRHHWPRFFWHIWRVIYVCYIYLLLGKYGGGSVTLRFAFIWKLLTDSSAMDGVDYKTFLKILNADVAYFKKS